MSRQAGQLKRWPLVSSRRAQGGAAKSTPLISQPVCAPPAGRTNALHIDEGSIVIPPRGGLEYRLAGPSADFSAFTVDLELQALGGAKSGSLFRGSSGPPPADVKCDEDHQ